MTLIKVTKPRESRDEFEIRTFWINADAITVVQENQWMPYCAADFRATAVFLSGSANEVYVAETPQQLQSLADFYRGKGAR